MLAIDQLLWVIPGICFLFAYDRLRDVESVEFSGWPFVFFIVLIGAVAYLPIKYGLGVWGVSSEAVVIAVSSVVSFLIPFVVKYCFSPFVKKLEGDPNFFMPSSFWSIVYFFYPLENRDKFIKNCIDWEGEAVIVTVEDSIIIKRDGNSKDGKNDYLSINSRVFLGFLVEFPYVAMKDVSSQVIRILPALSGYRYVGCG